MDVLTSAEFRKQYARLTAPTVVTVNGHAIGTWTPYRLDGSQIAKAFGEGLVAFPKTPQERRDDLLRQINRPAR